MSEAVFTAEKRVTFVKGWLTGGTDPADGSVECGDGTIYPMEVTLDQAAEIFYRVKKARITSGGFSASGTFEYYYPVSDYGYRFEYTTTSEVTSADPPDDSVSITAYGDDALEVIQWNPVPTELVEELVEECVYDEFLEETVCSMVPSGNWIDGDPPVWGSGRLTMIGTPNINYFGDRYVVGPFGGLTTTSTGYSGYLAAREPTGEIALFSMVDYNITQKYPDCHSAFYVSSQGVSTDPSSLLYAYGIHVSSSITQTLVYNDPPSEVDEGTALYEKIDTSLLIYETIVYTGESLTDPDSRFFIGLNFRTSAADNGVIGLYIRSEKISDPTYFKEVTTTLTLTLQLSNGQSVTCPLYAYFVDFPEGTNLDMIENTTTFSSQTNFVFTATEWWPYAKGNPATPVWNTATGVKL